ncbi:hypothetical protein Asp14428_15870 [Actinoplanes sp. NBRC 14428]|nr:hypothetical protein Asp14428_15870 [Actinoplanes sp. NBRC 14428]
MPDLDPRHLRYLIAVAETGSITRAARRLMMTQPALSRALQALERTVGVPLLVRRSQATGLTEAGSVLLADAYELVERSRAAIERARGAYSGAETLTVSAPVCDVLAVSAAGRDFEAGHPGVRVHVVPRGWPERPEELGATAADVAILRDCFDRGNLIVDPSRGSPARCCCRPATRSRPASR